MFAHLQVKMLIGDSPRLSKINVSFVCLGGKRIYQGLFGSELISKLLTATSLPLWCSKCLLACNELCDTLAEEEIMTQLKVIVEKHTDGYVAYPLGLKGIVVGEGNSFEEALADMKLAIRFHIETFGEDVLQTDTPVLEAFVAETAISAS